MAYPESPVQRTRPGTVSAAVFALYALAALQLIGLILQLTAIGSMVDAARDYLPDTTEGDTALTFLQITQYATLGIGFLFVIAYALLAVFNGRGRNVARIITWVVLGISLCCGAVGLGGAALGGAMGGGNSSTTGIDQEELTRRIEDAVPGWYNAASYTLLAFGLILAIVTIILLALPASNAYFRRPEPVWEPPVPGAVYPPPAGPGQPGPYQPGSYQPGSQQPGSDPGYPPPPAS
jgi:hypothetical protein